jgi:hypothetical protein
MGYTEAASNVRGARFAAAGQQVGDELDVVLLQSARLGRAGLAEPLRLGQFGGQLDCELNPFLLAPIAA